MKRKLNNYEIQTLAHLCGGESFEGCDCVEEMCPDDRDWYHIRLHYSAYPWPEGGYTVLADRAGKDADGSLVELLALGDEQGRVYELEIRRIDGNPIQRLPASSSWFL